MARFATLLLVAASLALPASAQADGPCDAHAFGKPTGPVQAGTNEGGLGLAHRVCGRSEVALDVGALLLVDLPFFARLGAQVRIDGSWAWGPRGELFGSWEALRYDSLIAPLASSTIGVGHLNVGAAYRFLDSSHASLGANAKLVLPTAAPLYQGVWPVGIDAGLAAQLQAHPKLQFHLQLGVLHSFGLGKGPAQPREGGVEWMPAPQFGLTVDVQTGFGYTGPVDLVAAALALRFSDGKRFGFEIGAAVPFAGRERTNVRLDFRASVRFGPITPAVPPPEEASP